MKSSMLTRYEQAHALLKSRAGESRAGDSGIDNDLVRNDTVRPHWISYADGSESHSFWYHR